MTSAPSAVPTLFGIPNCDTVKKARLWFADRGLAHDFHDVKKQGVSAEALAGWTQAVGWDRLLNRKGTTWRQLSPQAQAALAQPDAVAFELVQAQPSLMKRPVIAWPGGQVTVGMDAQVFTAAVATAGLVTRLP